MDEKKTIKISLGTLICLFIIFILIVALIGMFCYYNYFTTEDTNVVDNKTETNNIIVEENGQIYNNTEDLYKKYEGFYWLFNEENGIELNSIEFDGKKITVKNGVAYFEDGNSKKQINSIGGKVKYIKSWGEHTLNRVYALTEDGVVWRSNCFRRSRFNWGWFE